MLLQLLIQQIDTTHVLNLIQDEVEIKRDTERQDEIRAMKQAWEAAEPGRAAKAQTAREKFLKEHMVKVEQPEDETTEDKPEIDLEGMEGCCDITVINEIIGK